MKPTATPGLPRRGVLAGLAAASLLTHLGLLGLLTREPPAAGRRPPAPLSARPRSVVVRSTPVTDEVVEPPRTDTTAAEPLGGSPTRATPHADAAPASSAPTDAAPPPALSGPALDGPEDGVEYLPRSTLSVTPQATGDVLLAYPPGAPPGRHRGELTLFIDEHGTVQRVRVDSAEADLPAPFQEAARQAFLAARFTPGELQGRAVKARIRIAVEFEMADAADASADRGQR